MTQALNFTPKAIEALLSYPCPGAPLTALGNRYLAGKLREAQVFMLSDHGQLLDRSKPRPQVPGALFKPPFPVVALEYTALANVWDEPTYSAESASKRIALAWDWTDDLPPALAAMRPPYGPGVAVASIAYIDKHQAWSPMSACIHFSYDFEWMQQTEPTPFKAAMIASGRLNPALAKAPAASGSLIPIAPEVIAATSLMLSAAAAQDMLGADLMDEVNAYFDLSVALACKNVSTREYPAPKNLNRARIKAGKIPLKGFHVLELNGGEGFPGGGGTGDRAAARSHLRRGHIRRLGADRVTWVNSTIVRGRGFVDKVYAA